MKNRKRYKKSTTNGHKKKEDVHKPKRRRNNTEVSVRPISFILGLFFIVYLTMFALVKVQEKGSNGVNDVFFAGHLTLFIAGVGLVLCRESIIGIAIAFAAYPHMSFTYDIIYWLVLDKFPMGRCIFLEDIELHTNWWMTLHSVWMMPLLYAVLYLEYPTFEMTLRQFATATGIQLIFSALVKYNTIGSESVTHVLIGDEYWEPPDFFKSHDRDEMIPYLMWIFVFECLLLNSVAWVFLKLLTSFLFEQKTNPTYQPKSSKKPNPADKKGKAS